ncbi:MAG TPA: DNA alkylation repair protein [Lacunisphaera sp.]
MKLKEVMAALKARGSESIRRILMKHGAPASLLGVRIGDMKPIAKRIKGDQALALELYATGIGDAQYLAAMVADGRRMTARELQSWARTASWDMISGFAIAWVASENPAGYRLACKWIDSKNEHMARAGWSTLGAIAATVPDADLPVAHYGRLLDRVARELPKAPDSVRYQMNSFVIMVGTYVAPLGAKAVATARKLGRVTVDMGDTGCKVPEAVSYIMKCRRGAAVAPKRKTMRC